MTSEVQIPEPHNYPAFGETFGLEMPTRYGVETHAALNSIMAADSLITPLLLGMSVQTVWVCRAVAGLLFLTRTKTPELSLRHKLEIEAATGLGMMLLAWRGTLTRHWFENAYLFASGAIMVANSLMTELEPE